MENIALCIGKEKDVCYLIHGGEHHFLNSVEIVPAFEGAKIGQWFRIRIDRRKRRHIFESLAKSEAPSTRVWQDGEESVIQVQLPIFFVSDPDNDLLPDFRVFYSSLLDGSSLSVDHCGFSDDVSIKPWVQYEAFLSLRGWEVGIPRWKLHSLKDIVMESKKLSTVSKHVSTFHFSQLINQWEHGFVLKLFDDYCLALILCLQDGQLAVATNRTINGISVGDFIYFCCREIDRSIQPSITSSNLFVVDLSLSSETNSSSELPSDFSLKSLNGDKLFELRFPITNSMLSPTFTRTGSIHVDKFGVLLDPDGKLSSKLSHGKVGQLIVARASLCLVSERQSPLWLIVNVICEENQGVKESEKVAAKQSYGYTADNDLRREQNLNQYKENEDGKGSEADDQIDGAFGGGWKRPERKCFNGELKRENQSCVEESLNVSIGESSISSNETVRGFPENFAMDDGIALFINIRSYEWILALYDKRIGKFTQWCCTLIKSLPLNIGQRSPIPGSWFQISYCYYDTHQNSREQRHILIASMSPAQSDGLPSQIKPCNKEVWKMIIDGKFDSALKGGTTVQANNKSPIPVTRVFSRANSNAQIENHHNSRPKLSSTVFVSDVPINRRPTVPFRSDNDMLFKTRIDRYFCVEVEMAGIVVSCLRASNSLDKEGKNTYWIWPFCTGIQSPRELTLCTSEVFELGTWIKFKSEYYQRGEIDKFEELGHWLDTLVNEGSKVPKVCLECSIQIPTDYDPDSEGHNEIWTCRFKPKHNHIPFIKKLVPIDELKSSLKQYRGKSGVFARLEYKREFGRNGQTIGHWQIAELLTGMNRKLNL